MTFIMFYRSLKRRVCQQAQHDMHTSKHDRSAIGDGLRGIELLRELRVTDAVCSPARGIVLAVDGLMQQRIQRIGVPRHPCIKALHAYITTSNYDINISTTCRTMESIHAY